MAGPDQGLRRAQRLCKSAEINEAYDQGRKFVGRHVVVFLRSGSGAALRLGVVSSRKVGGAVERVRARRRLREAYRRLRPTLQAGCDVVLVARASAVTASWMELEEDLRRQLRRAGIGD